MAASLLLSSAHWVTAAEHRVDADDAFLAKRLATAPDLSKVDGVKFLQLHRNAEEALEGGKEDHSYSFIGAKGSMTVTGSPESILRRVSPLGAERIVLSAPLPMGYYQIQIHVEKGGQAEAVEKLAKVYRDVFGIVVKMESIEVPVLVLKIDPAKAGHLPGARTFLIQTVSVNHGTAESNGQIKLVREFIENDLKRPVVDETGERAAVNLVLKFSSADNAPTRLKAMAESLAGQGLFLSEERRKIDCITVVPAGDAKTESKPPSGPSTLPAKRLTNR